MTNPKHTPTRPELDTGNYVSLKLVNARDVGRVIGLDYKFAEASPPEPRALVEWIGEMRPFTKTWEPIRDLRKLSRVDARAALAKAREA